MAGEIYIDTQGIENSVYNAIVEALPDLTPLLRASYVYELQAVERRLEVVLGGVAAMREEDLTLMSSADPEAAERALGLWKRRGELLALLWPPVSP